MTPRPQIDNAPGLTWRPMANGHWEARWRARHDLVMRGYCPKSFSVWSGTEPDAVAVQLIQQRCQEAQRQMLTFGRGDIPKLLAFDGTLRGLINCYQTDPDSTYHGLRTATRQNYDARMRRLAAAHGAERIENIKARQVKQWHEGFQGAGGHVVAAHEMMTLLRILCRFGGTMLEDAECLRVSSMLSQMRFQGHRPRNQSITAEQVTALRRAAHAAGWPSMALAQALQYECTLRQKDVIGEWVRADAKEGGLSAVIDGNEKWIRGLCWHEIDKNLILRHVTSKKQKEVVVDLRLAPMVMEELQRFAELPASGPVIVNERTGTPYRRAVFRQKWRQLARQAGIPDSVFNMDSRSGAITEAILAGAPIEHVRHAATHSQVSQTADYDRGQADAIASVMRARIAHRKNKTGTGSGENA